MSPAGPEPAARPGDHATGSLAPASLLAASTLLLPADRSVTAAIAEGLTELPAHVDNVVAVHAPRAGGEARLQELSAALGRERLLARLRRLDCWKTVIVHRIAPGRGDGSSADALVRRALRGGAVVELARSRPARRHLDRVAFEAGLVGDGDRVRSFAVGSGGTVRVRGVVAGAPVVLRVAAPGARGGVVRAARALTDLQATGFPQAPRVVAHRTDGALPFLVESRLAGSRPAKLTADLARQVLGAWTALPRSHSEPRSFLDDLDVLARFLPERADRLHRLRAGIGPHLASLPGVARHGDLWAGNLLVHGRTLAGVVDWDAWHPAGVPAADLLHLLLTEERRPRGWSLGAVVRARPWRRLGAWLAPYWQSLDVDPGAVRLDAVAIASWAAAAAGTVARQPERATDGPWLADNVDGVLDTLQPAVA